MSRSLCVDWRDRFYNTDMYRNNLLMPVVTDTGREIHGRYDQTSGLLPVSGTDNVQGILAFEVGWVLTLIMMMAMMTIALVLLPTTGIYNV